MSDATVHVVIDNRVRLIGALLSLTTWPLQEQAEKPHGIHAHAKATQTHLKEFEDHPAVEMLQTMLESQANLDDIFSLAGRFTWPEFDPIDMFDWVPEGWLDALYDFAVKTNLADWWENEPHDEWNKAEQAAVDAWNEGNPRDLLMRFFGDLANVNYLFHPMLSFPTAKSIGYWNTEGLVAVCPPHVAWGNNPPWPYDQDKPATHRAALGVYIRHLLSDFYANYPDAIENAKQEVMPVPNAFKSIYTTWYEQFTTLMTAGITALYLRHTFNAAEEKAYLMMERKAHAYKDIHNVAEVLERFLNLQDEGKVGSFAEWLPTFQKTLRIHQGLNKD